ncbi:MAG: hypothetical protein NTV68_10755 [Methanomicrobiales archaeon]|nr:hypothetical protein [Methanomicrobiales archaeon]
MKMALIVKFLLVLIFPGDLLRDFEIAAREECVSSERARKN